MRAVSLLVLLCCSLLEGQSVSLSHYEGRENQIQAEDPRNEPPATTSTQQSCQPDIHSVLREMSAMLAELKVEQRHTTTAVNSMESRLRASESQMEELRKKVEEESQKNEEELKDLKTSFDSQVENLKMENQAQAVNQSVMEARFGSELEELKMKNNEELNDLKSSLKITEGQVKNLDKENQDRKVVFSASLSAGEAGHTGPYSTLFPLVYKHVFTNIGSAYNPATGIFTAPVRGVYQFKFHVFGGSGRVVAAVLHKNGHHITGAYSYQDQHNLSSSNGVSLLLEVGDVVSIKLHPNSWIYDNWFHHSTFSGQMLFSI
ncbi:multimerin-2-like isoform X2 [Colossoma macropomum]|uniref:multimerin-2-like isoform X2 n=1 Tax=Colossoma macropomum TaxID=42526 RepID=UPI001864908B|nr:multimerin-2-like isoform X2 [Colossoma macropomum]